MSIASYLSELVSQKNNLAANLVAKGVSASTSETMNTLVPKVLSISGGGGDEIWTGIVDGSLTSINDVGQSVSTIMSYAFYGHRNLLTVSFPAVQYIGERAFADCNYLTTASFPSATDIGMYAFGFCSSLTTANFPSTERILAYAFRSCISITTASFPAATSIWNYAFQNCYHLVSLYLMGPSVCNLVDSNAFNSTPIGGYSASAGRQGSIYVPANLYSQYVASGQAWWNFSSRIVSV